MNFIQQGDSKILSKELESESIDFIWPDPIYSNQEDYEWLGQEAFRLLKPNRAMMVWGSQRLVKDYVPLIEKSGLKYIWTFSYVVIAKSSRLIKQNIFTWTTPCMMFAKDDFSLFIRLPDTFIDYASTNGRIHKWNKNLPVFLYWMPAFTQRDWVVFDPFMGYGVTLVAAKKLGRQYIGFDLDSKCVEMTQQKLDNTMPDLFNEEISIAKIF